MTLAASDLLTLVNQITARGETSLTGYLRNVIHDLERDTIELEGSESFALTAGTRNYALSGLTYDYKRPFNLQSYDGTLYHGILTEISYNEYRNRLTHNRGNAQPEYFAVYNGSIYIDPPPSTTYTHLHIWGKINHGDSVTTILYPEQYRRLLVNGCAYEVFKRYGLAESQKAQECGVAYQDEKQKFIVRTANKKSHYAMYKDI